MLKSKLNNLSLENLFTSHILAGARNVARRVTEGRRPKGDRGTKCRVKKADLASPQSISLRSIECVTKL